MDLVSKIVVINSNHSYRKAHKLLLIFNLIEQISEFNVIGLVVMLEKFITRLP